MATGPGGGSQDAARAPGVPTLCSLWAVPAWLPGIEAKGTAEHWPHSYAAREGINIYGKIWAVPVKLRPGMHHLPSASWISELPLPTPGSEVCPAPLVLQQSSIAWSVVQSFGGRKR